MKLVSKFILWFVLSLGVVVITFQACGTPSKVGSRYQATAPVIFNHSISGKPGDVIYLQGANFGSNPQVIFYLRSQPSTPSLQIPIVNKGNNYIAAQIPGNVPLDLYAIQVYDGTNFSRNTVYLNQAHGMSFDTPEIAANGSFRIFGRNLLLSGATPTVRYVDPSTGVSLNATVRTTKSDAYALKVKAPPGITPGINYNVYVSNGYGVEGETKVDETLVGRQGGVDHWQLGVAWAADYDFYNNVYNVKTDPRLTLHAVGDGINNEQPAIQQAISAASAAGGGVVYLPMGVYRLATPGQGLVMASRVVLVGSSMDATVLNFGYGKSQGEQGIMWNGASVSGIADLTYRNVNENGHWTGNLSAYGSSSELFIQRARLELNSGGGVYWDHMPKVVVENSIINQSYAPDNQNGGPWHLDGDSYFVISGNHVTSFDQYGLNFTENGVFESNHMTKDAKVYVPGRNLTVNFAKNLVILNNTFDLINQPDKVNNDGETILSEGGGDKRLNSGGVASAATSQTLKDSSKNWSTLNSNPDIKYPIVAIVSGVGAGQWREIISNTSTTLSVNRPWDVVPTAGSHYTVIAWSAANWIIKGNTLKDHGRGIELYDASTRDVAIVDNQLLNNGGIWLRGNQDLTNLNTPSFDIIYDTQVIGNTISSTRVTADKSQDQAAMICVQPALVRPNSIFGTSTLGVEIRANVINGIPNHLYSDDYQDGYYNNTYSYQPENNLSEGGIPSILGTIFQGNICHNCHSIYTLNGGAYQTTILGAQLNSSSVMKEDTSLAGTSYPSVGTIIRSSR